MTIPIQALVVIVPIPVLVLEAMETITELN